MENKSSLSAYGRVVIDGKNIYYRVNINGTDRIYLYEKAIPVKVAPNIDKKIYDKLLKIENRTAFLTGSPIVITKNVAK